MVTQCSIKPEKSALWVFFCMALFEKERQKNPLILWPALWPSVRHPQIELFV